MLWHALGAVKYFADARSHANNANQAWDNVVRIQRFVLR